MDKQVMEKLIKQLENLPESEINNLINHIEFLIQNNPKKDKYCDLENYCPEAGP